MAQRVRESLERFWEAGITGADFFMSAIGRAVQEFGRYYARVERFSGEDVTVAELLDEVQKLVAEFALERMLETAELGEVGAPTRLYCLWRYYYGSSAVPFDEASKLARAVGVELTELWGPGGLVEKVKEKVSLRGPDERRTDRDFLEREEMLTVIDALHKAVILRDRGDMKALETHLALNGGDQETFRLVTQAAADLLPSGNREKQLLQGLLLHLKNRRTVGSMQTDMLGSQE